MYILERKNRNDNAAVLTGTGRDVEQREISMRFSKDRFVWEMIADSAVTPELLPRELMCLLEYMKHPEQEQILEETYDEMEAELQKKIEGIRNQISMLSDKRNTILRVNRAAKTAMDVFRDILQKEKLERNDLELIISKIKVYEDHLEIMLKADVDALIRCGTVEMAANFDQGIRDNLSVTLVQSATHQKDKVFDVNVISDGDLFRIEIVSGYPLDHDALLDYASNEQSSNARPALTAVVENFAEYDTILLGYRTVPYPCHKSRVSLLQEDLTNIYGGRCGISGSIYTDGIHVSGCDFGGVGR